MTDYKISQKQNIYSGFYRKNVNDFGWLFCLELDLLQQGRDKKR